MKSFDGERAEPITDVILLFFAVDEKRFSEQPFLIANLGSHDVIIGRKWLEQQDAWLGVKDRIIKWPDCLPPTESFDRLIPVTQSSLAPQVPDESAQEDADRRDAKQAIAEREALQRRVQEPLIVSSILARPVQLDEPPKPVLEELPTPQHEARALPSRQREALEPLVVPSALTKPWQPFLFSEQNSIKLATSAKAAVDKTLLSVDIALISAPAFTLHTRRKSNLVFATNLYKID